MSFLGDEEQLYLTFLLLPWALHKRAFSGAICTHPDPHLILSFRVNWASAPWLGQNALPIFQSQPLRQMSWCCLDHDSHHFSVVDPWWSKNSHCWWPTHMDYVFRRKPHQLATGDIVGLGERYSPASFANVSARRMSWTLLGLLGQNLWNIQVRKNLKRRDRTKHFIHPLQLDLVYGSKNNWLKRALTDERCVQRFWEDATNSPNLLHVSLLCVNLHLWSIPPISKQVQVRCPCKCCWAFTDLSSAYAKHTWLVKDLPSPSSIMAKTE